MVAFGHFGSCKYLLSKGSALDDPFKTLKKSFKYKVIDCLNHRLGSGKTFELDSGLGHAKHCKTPHDECVKIIEFGGYVVFIF